MTTHKTGEWMDCTIAAKPASKKARHPYATVTAVFYVAGDYPDRDVANRIVNAPVLLAAAEARLAEVTAKRDALADHVAICPDCGEVETCDEDRCCSCGLDLLVFADRYSAELYQSREQEHADRLAMLRMRVAEVNEVLCSGADDRALRAVVAGLCSFAQLQD